MIKRARSSRFWIRDPLCTRTLATRSLAIFSAWCAMAGMEAAGASGAGLSITLSDGATMPTIGYGLYLIPPDEAEACVLAAVAAGYRHFDGAAFYDNEAAVGRGLARAVSELGVPRAELFVTTKVWTTDRTFEDALASVERSHAELGGAAPLSLALVHWPVPGGAHVEMYRALQECVRRGLVERIGLSNYTPEDYEELMASGAVTIRPVVNQIEVSPFLHRADAIAYFRARGVVVQVRERERERSLPSPLIGTFRLRRRRAGVQAAPARRGARRPDRRRDRRARRREPRGRARALGRAEGPERARQVVAARAPRREPARRRRGLGALRRRRRRARRAHDGRRARNRARALPQAPRGHGRAVGRRPAPAARRGPGRVVSGVGSRRRAARVGVHKHFKPAY